MVNAISNDFFKRLLDSFLKGFMLQQLLYIGGSILILPFLPFLLFLGKRVRQSIPDLPEACENLTSSIIGNSETIQLLTLGESTIAGVGVTDHTHGITGQLAKTLHISSGNTINWKVLACNGYTAEKVNQLLVPQIPEHALDFIVIGLGGNDTFKFNSPLTFKKNMIRLIDNIQLRQPNAQIIIANMPPIGDFPAFPWLIQLVLGSLVKLHGAVIRDIPQRYNNVSYMDETIRIKDWISRTDGNWTSADLFSDGVHPSALTYAIWGEEIGRFVMDKNSSMNI